MKSRWAFVQIWAVVIATVWLVAGGAPASPPTRVPTPAALTAAPVAGNVFDADAPALYRLPRLSSFAPVPAEPVNVDQVPVVAAPVPPTRGATTVASDDAKTTTVIEPPQISGAPPPAVIESDCPETPRAAEVDVASDDAPPPIETPKVETSGVSATGPISPSMPAWAGPGAMPCAGSTTELTPQMLPLVQRGYALAQRGAMYAARAEFVQVLRRIAQAKDAATNSDVHSRALAAGLRAIDEAEDFVPDGVRVEAELDVHLVASSHRTPVLADRSSSVSPHEAVALYHGYAQQQLAAAVGGEQAGSMALYGLGKVSATLAERSGDDAAMKRSAMTMYSAALAACPANHLAANELGVLLVRGGRTDEAARLFERTIDLAPSATAYHNLSVAQGKLGFFGPAAANEEESQRLAAYERTTGAVSRRAGVEWVSPEAMSGVVQPALPPTAQVPPRRKSAWQKTKEIARSLPLPGVSKNR